MPHSPSGPAARALPSARLAVLAAFSEAMASGAAGLPPAEREIPVAANFGAISSSLSRRQRSLVSVAIAAFDWLAFPRRFSRLPLDRRIGHLQRLAGSRWSAHQELLMLMKTLHCTNYLRDERVSAAVGFEARCEVDGDAPHPPGPLGSLEACGEGEECDVAIIGSGAGGAAAATVLAEAGLDVLVLEAGPHADRDSYPSDPVEGTARLYRDAGLTLALGLPPVPIPIGRMVGGTTVINSGTCFRAPDPILREWRDSYGIGWATELEAEFEEAEGMLAVKAPAMERIGRNGRLVAEGAAALGLAGAPLARNAGDCVQCSSCPQGCRLDAKRAMHVSYLPRAVAAGARIRSGIEARTIRSELGRARIVECRRSGGGTFTVVARRAIICAGGSFGTPELLLRSGLGGHAVGRNLRLHPSTWVGARFDQPVRGWEGIMQSYGVDEWASEGLMLEATFTPLAYAGHWLPGVGPEHEERLAAFDHLGANGVQLRDVSSRGRISLLRDGSLRTTYRLRRAEARRLALGMARAAEIWFAAGAQEVYPQFSGSPVLRPGDESRLRTAPPPTREMRLEAFHPMGTARIGSDPATTVAGPDGAVRGIDRLYVADASVFPTSLGVNPMVTIIAAASRIAREIAARVG